MLLGVNVPVKVDKDANVACTKLIKIQVQLTISYLKILTLIVDVNNLLLP